MRKKRVTAALTALALTAGSISFPVNSYAEPKNVQQETETKENEAQQDKEQEGEEKENDKTETAKPEITEPEEIVTVIKDKTYTNILAKDEKRVALYDSAGKLIIFDGQEKTEKIIYDKEGNELKIDASKKLSSYLHVSDKDNKKQLSDMDGNLFRNGDKFYQKIEILDNKYVIYSEDGESFSVSTFDSDKDIAEFKRSEYGGGSSAEYGFTNFMEKIEAGNAVYYVAAVSKEYPSTYTIFDENFHLLTDNIREYFIFESEYFDDVFLACTPETTAGETVKTLLFDSRYECVDMDARIEDFDTYSYFENDENYICIARRHTIDDISYDIVDRQYRKIFDGTVDLKYYDKSGIEWNEDGSGIDVAARKVIIVLSEDETASYYIYKDGSFHEVAQGMKLVDAEGEYSLYEADGKQELYYQNEKVWSGSDKYQGIWLKDTAAALIHKESQYLYDIYVPENHKIELADIDSGFKIKNHRFLGKSNGKILFYDLEKEEVIYNIDEELMEGADGIYNGGPVSIRNGEVHDAEYDGTNSEGNIRFPYLACTSASPIGSYYAYPGIFITEDFFDYITYQVLEQTMLENYYPCINFSGYICALHYGENGMNVITEKTAYNLGNSYALTYTDKYFMYYDKTEEKVLFLNLETGDKTVLNELLDEKYSELIYENQTISYNLSDISIVQNMMRQGFYSQKQCLDIIDGENIYFNINTSSDTQKSVQITLVLNGADLGNSYIYPGNIIYNAEECFFTYDGNKLYKVDKQLKKLTGELELTADNIECENLLASDKLAVYPCGEKFAFIKTDTFAKTEVPVLENADIYQDVLYGYNKESGNLEIYQLSAGKLIKEIPALDYIENDYKLESHSKVYFTEDSDIGRIYFIDIMAYDKDMQYYPLADFYCDENGNEVEIEEIEGKDYTNEIQDYSKYYVKSKNKIEITDQFGNILITLKDTPRFLGGVFGYSACLEDGTKCLLDGEYNIIVENQEFIEDYLAAVIPIWRFGVNGKIYWILQDAEENYSFYDEEYNLITDALTWRNEYGGARPDLESNYNEGIYYTDKGIYYLGLEGPVFYESALNLCKLNDKYIAVTYEDSADIIDRETLRTIYKMEGSYKFHYYGELIENYYLAQTVEENKRMNYLVYFGADKQILDKDGLLVITDKNGQLPEDTVLSVEDITDSFVDKDILSKLEENYILNQIYNISLYLGENEIQIKEAATVMIPLLEAAKQTYKVFRIEEDGSLTDMQAVQKDNYLVFVAEHFSKYAVVQNSYTLGDVNGDGQINIKDSALTRRHVAKWKVDINLDAADVNKDGTINIKDSALIRRYVAKWIEEF